MIRRRAADRARRAVPALTAALGLLALLAWRPGCAEPLEVTDDTGAAVALPRPASRIVSLAPSITEQLFAIGAGGRIVGTSASSDYPDAAQRIPVVAGADGVDLERIASLRPDLVIVWGSGYPAATQEALRRLGAQVYVSEPASLESIATSMERLARLTGAPDGTAQARRFRATLAQLHARYAGRSPVRAFYQTWPQPLMTLSGHQVIGDALALCGARNVFQALASPAPTVSAESVIATDPQIILTDEPGGADRGALDFWKRYPFVAAVAHGQLYTLDSGRISRPTPRMLPEVQRMCERIEQAREADTR